MHHRHVLPAGRVSRCTALQFHRPPPAVALESCAAVLFFGASLPRAVRVAEVHRNAPSFAELPVHRHLPPLVVRQALAHGRCDPQQFVGEGLQHVGRAGGLELGQLDEHEQPAGALHQGPHRTGVGRSLDQVALPAPGKLPVFNLKRAQVDAHHVRDLTSTVLSFAARHALVVGIAQVGDQFALELAQRLGVDAALDGLV